MDTAPQRAPHRIAGLGAIAGLGLAAAFLWLEAPLDNPRAGAAFLAALGVAVVAGGVSWRLAPAAASWLALTILGWAATLQLIDAPAAVAYQHLDVSAPSRLRLVAIAVLSWQALALMLAGRDHVWAVWRWLRTTFPPAMIAAALAIMFLTAAVPSRDAAAYLTELTISTLLQLLSLFTLVAAARSTPPEVFAKLGAPARWLLGPADVAGVRRINRWILTVAALVIGIASLLSWGSYQWHPHLPDEVGYLLHARYFAEGMWAMPLPPVPAGFHLDLMHYDATRWYSPVPPGWPMVLAVGARLGLPWLVNPVLAGLAVVLAYLLIGRLTTEREARLTTLLLAFSPWFLFMAMNLMTHTLTLVSALAAALGVSMSRERGTWRPALLAGLAVGFVSLVRPLEGIIVAMLLGFWSLAARGKWFRFAPSVALVIGTLTVALLQRPYNAMLTGSPRVFPIMAYFDKYYAPGSNDMGFGANRGLGWTGLDPFPGHGAIDVVINAALNVAQVNVDLLGWPIGSIVFVAGAFLFGPKGMRRLDWWYVAVIAAVAGVHAFYWFSGGPDFGARYWYLIILPCCALVARALTRLDERVAPDSPMVVRSIGVLLTAVALTVYVPWRALGKYYHYRQMRPDVRVLAREHAFGRSLVLVRGARHPDYASAAAYNPVDLRADAPIYAWDASPGIREALLNAYPDRTVWIIDGPSLTRGKFEIVAGPLTPSEARTTTVPPDAAGSSDVYDPVNPPRQP